MGGGLALGPASPAGESVYSHSCLFARLFDADIAAAKVDVPNPSGRFEPRDEPYGDRASCVTDAFGNMWSIATHVRDVPV